MQEIRMNYLKFLVASALLLLAFKSIAQVPTEAQCQATLRARAPISIDANQVEKICEENAMVVINCALNEFQSAPLSGNFERSLRHCRVEYSVYYH
jgi:hypothetical protein